MQTKILSKAMVNWRRKILVEKVKISRFALSRKKWLPETIKAISALRGIPISFQFGGGHIALKIFKKMVYKKICTQGAGPPAPAPLPLDTPVASTMSAF